MNTEIPQYRAHPNQLGSSLGVGGDSRNTPRNHAHTPPCSLYLAPPFHLVLPRRVTGDKDAVTSYLGVPGSWLVQGTLGLAYPASFESHVNLAQW